MLVQFLELSEIADDENSEDRGQKLQLICQLFVDYISAGHFEVYDQLVKEAEDFDDQSAIQASKEAFVTVDKTTESILDFNDKYQEIDDLHTLSTDLSALGEAMAERFEAEDKMIEVMHNSHRDQIA